MDFIGTDNAGYLVYMNQYGFVAGFKTRPFDERGHYVPNAGNKATPWFLLDAYAAQYGLRSSNGKRRPQITDPTNEQISAFLNQLADGTHDTAAMNNSTAYAWLREAARRLPELTRVTLENAKMRRVFARLIAIYDAGTLDDLRKTMENLHTITPETSGPLEILDITDAQVNAASKHLPVLSREKIEAALKAAFIAATEIP